MTLLMLLSQGDAGDKAMKATIHHFFLIMNGPMATMFCALWFGCRLQQSQRRVAGGRGLQLPMSAVAALPGAASISNVRSESSTNLPDAKLPEHSAATSPANMSSTQLSSAAGAVADSSGGVQLSSAPAVCIASAAALAAAPARSRFSIGMLAAAVPSEGDMQCRGSLFCATPTAPELTLNEVQEEDVQEDVSEILNQSSSNSSTSTSALSSKCMDYLPGNEPASHAAQHIAEMQVGNNGVGDNSSGAQEGTEAVTPNPGSTNSSTGGSGSGIRARAQQLVQPEWLALQKAALAEMQQAFKAYGLAGGPVQLQPQLQESRSPVVLIQSPAEAQPGVMQDPHPAAVAVAGAGLEARDHMSLWRPVEPPVGLLEELPGEKAAAAESNSLRQTPLQPAKQRVKSVVVKQRQQQATVAAARQRRIVERQAYGQQQALDAQQQAARRAARAAELEAARKDKVMKAGSEKQEVRVGSSSMTVLAILATIA
jgi:hypothetical protein